MDFSKIQIACSNIPLIMGDYRVMITDRQKAELAELRKKVKVTQRQKDRIAELSAKEANISQPISEGTKSHLIELHTKEVYGARYYPITAKPPVFQLERGKRSEASAFSLILDVFGMMCYKDKAVKSNPWLRCSIDAMNGKTLAESSRIIEIKSSYELTDFIMKSSQPIPKRDFWQTQGMLSVTGKKEAEIIYVLSEFSQEELQLQKTLLFEKMCEDGEVTDSFLRKWEHAEKCLTFADIPKRNRIFSHLIKRDEDAIAKIHQRVEDCRVWLQNYHNTYQEHFKGRYAKEQ